MSGPRDPWRSRWLSKAAEERQTVTAFKNWTKQTNGIRAGRRFRFDALRPYVLEGLAPVEPRETRERDRSLRGKARRRARKVA